MLNQTLIGQGRRRRIMAEPEPPQPLAFVGGRFVGGDFRWDEKVFDVGKQYPSGELRIAFS